jgi:hypothetical protein
MGRTAQGRDELELEGDSTDRVDDRRSIPSKVVCSFDQSLPHTGSEDSRGMRV